MGHFRNVKQIRLYYFNPPIPCGMGRCAPLGSDWSGAISIHPSRVGWDTAVILRTNQSHLFQSTHPVWDGTGSQNLSEPITKNFNPPIPCGMGPYDTNVHACPRDFNPPIPCGMGLEPQPAALIKRTISIHPSRVGWDQDCKFLSDTI